MTIAIIGGGAAGMMAAATILETAPTAKVILIEKNASLGRKVIISGGGRCNVTTGIHNVRDLLTRYYRGSKFLTTAMYQFPPDQVYQWFEEHGVPLKTEDDLRVFPQSNNGKDIVGVFESMFAESNVELILRQGITQVEPIDSQFSLTLKDGRQLLVDVLILTTGGQAYRHTGSTGEGYKFAENLGHTITDLAASLNSFHLQESWTGELAGVSFEKITLRVPNRKEYIATGPIVFTHKGISGPAVFALSAQVAFENYNTTTPLAMTIDFVPDVSLEQLQTALQNDILASPTRLLSKTLQKWLPKSVIKELHISLQIPEDIKNASVSKPMRAEVLHWLKSCTVHAIGRGAGSEFITAGGVDTKDVNPRTMESLVSPKLLFAGEILNIDGITGGFNLQAAWATGRLAGLRAAELVA